MAEINGKKVVFSAHLHMTGTDTSDADATAADIMQGKTAYVNGEKLTGTLVISGGADTAVYNTINQYLEIVE